MVVNVSFSLDRHSPTFNRDNSYSNRMTTAQEESGAGGGVVMDRERGTSRWTAPRRRPDVIVGIANVVCTVAAVLICCQSQGNSHYEDNWPTLVVGAAMGSHATLAGIKYADSGIHSFVLGLAVLVTFLVNGVATGKGIVETILLSLSLSRAMLLVALLSRNPVFRLVFRTFTDLFAKGEILKPILMLTAVVIVMLPDYVQVEFPLGVPALLGMVTLVMCGLYYYNRSFSHGNLMIQPEQRGMAGAAALAWTWTVSSVIEKNVAADFLPILVGSTVTVLLSIVFCSVAQVWDAVRSGQFQMVSIETAVFVAVPLFLLWDNYKETIRQALSAIITSQIRFTFRRNARPPEQPLMFGLFILLSLATMIGVPLVNMLSPLYAYIVSRAYTHGQPRTRRVALCIHFQDLCSNESKEKTKTSIQNLIHMTQEKNAVINIFVTARQLRHFPEIMVELQSAQHCIGICSDTVDGISDAFKEYVQLLKMEPQWYHVGSQGVGVSSACVGPNALKTAANLNMKVAFWSTYIAVGSREAFLFDLPNLCTDVNATMGGNMIYLVDTRNDVDSFVSAIDTIVQELGTKLEINYSFSALSDVAKDDAAMTLGLSPT